MKNSKEKIISELKNKLIEFKSKIRNNKSQSTIGDDDISNMQININTIKNYYKIQKEDNVGDKIDKKINNVKNLNEEFKESKNDIKLNADICNSSKTLEIKNIIKDAGKSKINKFIKEKESKEKLRANSTSTSNFITNKNYLNFDINEIIKQSKRPKKEKSEINFITFPKKSKDFLNFDELINIHKNQKCNFIKLNLGSKKSVANLSSKSNTDRNYRFINNFNSYTTDNKYEENFSEPNNIIINKNNYNYLKLQTKLSDFMNEINLADKNKRNLYKNRLSLTKPAIKNDKSKYDLNFMKNYDNNKENIFNNQNNQNINYKIHHNNYNLGDILNSNINENKEDLRYYSIGKNSTLYNISTIKNNNFCKTNSNIMKTMKNRNLSNFDFNNSNKYSLNIYDNNKNNNSVFNDISKVKFYIQNLSNDDINNLPFSAYKEIKELYNLIYIKFFKNN